MSAILFGNDYRSQPKPLRKQWRQVIIKKTSQPDFSALDVSHASMQIAFSQSKNIAKRLFLHVGKITSECNYNLVYSFWKEKV